MSDSFGKNLRQAHRIVAAYERRILDAMSFVNDKLAELEFETWEWSPQYHARPPDADNSRWTSSRWVWDYLPLNCVGGWWMRGTDKQGPGTTHVVVEHILDTGIEWWRRSAKHGEPDPLQFPAEADTLWRARILHNPPKEARIPDALWDKNWCDLFGALFAPSMDAADAKYPPPAGVFQRTEAQGLKASQLCVSLDALRTPEDFSAKFVEPLIAEVAALVGEKGG